MPLTPARLYDSRPGTSTVDGIGVGAGAQGPGSVRTVQVLGRGGVPSSGVEAVVLHLTSAQSTAQTYVSAWASDQPQPATSVFNPGPTGPDSNLVVVPVGPGGKVSLFNSVGSLHLIVDVQGWFPTGSNYEAAGPARIFDTRSSAQPLGSGLAVDVPIVGVGGVPATGVGSVVMNVTAVDPTEPSYLTVYPAGTPRPDTSNLNTRPGRVSANLVVARPGTDGKVSIYNRTGRTQLIIDVVGWFADGSDYVPLKPARVLDTRGASPVGAGATIRLPLAGVAGVPAAGAGTVVVNLTAPSATERTYLTVYPTGLPQPVASDLNPRPGWVGANTIFAKLGPDGSISIFNETGSVEVIVDVVGWLPSSAVAADDAATVAQDSAATTIDVLANDTDPAGGTKVIASVTQPSNGTAAILGGGSAVSYRPNAGYCNNPPGSSPDVFSYALVGGATATVAVTVDCDQLPVAVDDSATVAEDASATAVAVLVNDTDVDGGPKLVVSVTQPDDGAVVITGGGTGLTYQPDANACNTPPGTTPDTFTYTLNGGSTATVTMTVNCVDDAPVAVADSATVSEDASATAVAVLVNDTDVDGGPKLVVSVTQPDDGAVVITGGGTGLTYQPDANACNTPPGTTLDTFTYTLNGGSSATVTMTVDCLDDAPVAVDDSATVAEDASATAVAVLVNDTDVDGGPMQVASVTQPTNGTVAITGGGTGLTYQPDANVCNTPPGTTLDTFTYTLNGGSTATVTMTVNCVDDAPVAVADSATVSEDASATAVAVLVNDTDVDAGLIEVVSVTQPGSGTVVITGGGTGLTYQPDANVCNTPPGTTLDTFTYTLNGGSTATVTMTVNCVDDAPVAVADSATVSEDASATAVAVLVNDTDVDGGPKLVVSVTQPDDGAVVITGGGTGLTYQPNANACNTPPDTTLDTFTYTLNGGSTATVTMTVNCVNDAPSVTPPTYASVANMKLSVPAGTGLLADASDPDGSTTLSVTNVSAITPSGGTVTLVGTAGAFDVSGPPGFAGALTFTYQVCDDGIPAPSACSGAITATVNIAGPVVWFVDPAAATSGDGRLGSPFKTLAEAETAIGTNNGQGVYLAAGTSPSGITLRPQGRLVGQGATGLTFDQFFGLTVPSGVQSRPAVGTGTATVGGSIALATGSFVRGIAVNTATGGVSGNAATGVDVDQTSITSTAGPALDLSTVGGSLTISSLTQTAGTTAVNVVNSGAAVTLSGGAISGTTGTAINLDGGNGTFTAATTVNVSTGRAVAVQNRAVSSGASFSGAITATGGTGVLLASNAASAAVDFTGALTLSTGANNAFDASSGIVTSTSSASALTTTTGTALRVSGATIGTAGITLRSVSANGAASGIVLANTGTSGSVTVTGTGGPDSGGTISNTSGPGISLTNTKSPSFTRMKIQTTAGSGVAGSTVNGLSFTNGTITGSGSAAATGTSNIAVSELTGAVTITGNLLTTAGWHGIDIANTTGTISSATITGNTVTSSNDANISKGSGIRIALTGGAAGPTLTTAALSNNTITNFPSGGGIDVVGQSGGSAVTVGSIANPITISGNTIRGESAINRMGTNAIRAIVDGNASGAFTIANNTLSHTSGHTVALAGNGQSTTRFDVTGNTIVANNLFTSSGISLGTGPRLLATETPTVNAVISNNTISATDGNGILAVAREAAGQLNVKIQNNNVSAPLTGARPGIRIDAGSVTSTGDKVCLNISGNTTVGSTGTPGIGLRRQASPSGVFAVNGMVATATPDVENYVTGLNGGSVGGTFLLAATTGFTGCSLP